MTVETPIDKITVNGNGVATTFSFSPVVITQDSDLLVYLLDASGNQTLLTEGAGASQYTITPTGTYPCAGSISYPGAGGIILPTGSSITMKRQVTIQQTMSLDNQGGYFPDTQEAAFDYLTYIALDQAEAISRTVRASVTDTGTLSALPDVSQRAGLVLGFDSAGDVAMVGNTATTGDGTLLGVVASGTTISRSLGFRFSELKNVLDFGAKGNGTADDTSAIQAAINAAQATGGGVWFPASTYKITGTLTISASNVSLLGAGRGATVLNFVNGGGDCILLQGSGQIENITIAHMSITGTSKTGGNAINAQVVAYLSVRDVFLETPYNGVLFYQTNTVVCERLDINLPAGAYAGKWDSPTTNNSSALTLSSCTWQGGYLGAAGFIWDGWATSLRTYSLILLGFTIGQQILNSRLSTTSYPSFARQYDLEIDGCSVQSLHIAAGFDFGFIGGDISNTSGASGQGGADIDTITILPDTSYSYTRLVWFSETQIGNTQRRAVDCSAKNVYFLGCAIHDVSKAGTNSYPAMEFGTGAQGTATSDCQVAASQVGVIFGDGLRASYGITLNSGCERITWPGSSFGQCDTGAISNSSGNATNGPWNVDYNDLPMPITIPPRSSDPASPSEGQFWENTTTHVAKAFLNGATITFAQTASPTFTGTVGGANVIPNATLAQMPAATLKANATGSTANVADITVPQVQALLGTGSLIFIAQGVNFNSANTDTAIVVTLPTGFSNYIINSIRLSGASASLSTATCGVFTAPGAGGTSIVASGTAITVTTAAANTANNAQNFTIQNTGATESLNFGTLYFRVQNAQGSAATGTVIIVLTPVS